ncbi:MAG: hypothetical protein US98_C0008G0015 [Parcubacteria group bacterium GW2011_GWC1_38_6]|nr:MAG: hypothetical protein US98_C0008G0015 [Parcubacteria group bacterium GW2011_GWC1_38_6]
MKKTIFVLGMAGLLFAGYLSAVKLFNQTCALGESCAYFLGYPACYYGFLMYLLITIFAGLLLWSEKNKKMALNGVTFVSFLGILFAGYFTINELPLLFTNGFSAYFFGLPTCALGLLFYIAIFTLSFFERSK